MEEATAAVVTAATPPPSGMTTQGLELPLGLCPGDKGAGAGRTAWSRRACRLAI